MLGKNHEGNCEFEEDVLLTVKNELWESPSQSCVKTLFQGVLANLNINNLYHSPRPYRDAANPLLQSFEGIFKGLIEQMCINLSCADRCMPESLLNDEDVRGASKQSGCEAMPETVRCDSLGNSSFDNPLVEATLNLSCCNSLLQLAEEERLAISKDLLACFQIAIQDSSQLGVEKAIDNLSALGFDSDFLFQQVNVSDIQVNQLGQSNAGKQEEINNDHIAVCLPTLLRSDGLEKDAFLILDQEDRRLSLLVFDLNSYSWIVIEVSCVNQPAEKSFDRSPGAIDGRCQLHLTVGLFLDRIGEKEAIDIGGCDIPNVAVVAKVVAQQIQIALLRADGMGRSAIGELMIQELPDRLVDFHYSSSGLKSSSGCQLHMDWLVMNSRTFLPMNLLIGAVILRSPISWKLSRFSWKSTVAIELEYRIDFTSAIRVSYVFSVMLGLLYLSSQTDEFTLIGDAEIREVSRPDSHPAGTGFDFITHSNPGELEAISLAIAFFLEMPETVELPALGLCPDDELFFLHFLHCGLLKWFGLVLKSTVQQCSEKSVKSSHTMIINATVQW